MYSQEIGAVKSKLRGLWNQYNAAPPTTGNRGVDANGVPTTVEEMLLFPTYAFRDERLKAWRVQVRGWAFCRDPTTRRVRLATSLMRRFIRITAGGDSDQMLSDRISYLFAAPPQCDLVRVAMAGIAEPQAFELHAHARPGQHPPPARGRTEKTEAPVSLLDAPLVLTSQADPTRVAGNPEPPRKPPRHNGHHHDTLVAGPGAEQAAIVHKALQIDAFAWQALTLEDGVFSGEILVGYNELEWLVRSYQDSSTGDPGANGRRRLVELRGKLGGWIEERAIAGLAHLVEPQGISIVSDIDDTIKASNITAEKRIVLETVFARPPQAVPGMAALYRRWYELGAEFHYVSNSPWQLYPSLDGFFHQNRFPPGSAHLRAFDPNDLLSIKNYTGTPQLKRDTIEKLFATFPERKYVLVGDCGEQDLETYAELARRFPGRILRIYIRDLFAPMSVASLTTDTAAADTVRKGTIPYGVVQPQAPKTHHPDMIHLGDDRDTEDAQHKQPPPLPPKPAHLRTPAIRPPPKPPRAPSAMAHHQSSSSLHSAPPIPPRRVPSDPPQHPRLSTTSDPPRHTTTDPLHAPTRPNGNLPIRPETTTSNIPLDAAEQLRLKFQRLRNQAQQWLAFYAQQFYVAPTRSYLRCAPVFMPTVEQDLRIIDYDAIREAPPDTQMPPGADGSMPNAPMEPTTPSLDIPEPPPPESQLVRNDRRLLLWKRYLVCTRDLPSDLCRLFVDAGDIEQDKQLFTHIFPQHSYPQL